MKKIQEVWRSFYGEQVPIAYLLRQRNHRSWFRIHSLPDSKRYANDETETQEILRRHNLIADAVLGNHARCVLFFPAYALQKFPSIFAEMDAELFFHYEDEDAEITQFATQTWWQTQKFDAILRLVANDEVRYISWMNVQSGEIFAPYDGGADLFLNSQARRDEFRARYTDWLSKHPEGF